MKKVGLMLGAAVLAIAYWALTNAAFGVTEPWDAEQYLYATWPGSLLLSGALGYAMPKAAWRWGAIVTLAQLPVMVAPLWAIGASVGPLFGLGLIFLIVLSIPAALASAVGGWLRTRQASRASVV